ncbi:MAG: hypothetical protein AAGG01_20740 [Planctomycetota bacterium]
MTAPEDLIGRSTAEAAELTELVRIDGHSAQSSASRFDELLQGAAFFPGAGDLLILKAPTSSGTWLDRCSSFCRALLSAQGGAIPSSWDRATLESMHWLASEQKGWRRKPARVDKKLLDWTGADVGRALWGLAAFGEVAWDWTRETRRAESEVPVQSKRVQAPSVTAEVEWDHGRREVDASTVRIRKALIRLPMPTGAISRKRFEGLVNADLAALSALCGKAGVVSHGVLESPYSKVERSMTLRSTAKETLVILETRSTWLGVRRCGDS